MIELNFTPFPKLVTERLLLRSLQTTDANEIFALRSDDNVNKYLGRPKAKTIEDAGQFIEKILNSIANDQCLWWAIEIKPETVLAGAILLWNIDKEKNEIEIGYELLPQYHGKGIIQEAMQVVLRFGFESLKFNSIVAIVHKENIPSIKILERNSFVLKAETENNLLEYILFAKDFNRD
jgi:ribosomal-protein-alanine N-acetyltransferase